MMRLIDIYSHPRLRQYEGSKYLALSYFGFMRFIFLDNLGLIVGLGGGRNLRCVGVGGVGE